jgi:hypothetical protein
MFTSVALAPLVNFDEACVLLQGNQYEAQVVIYGPVHVCGARLVVIYI